MHASFVNAEDTILAYISACICKVEWAGLLGLALAAC